MSASEHNNETFSASGYQTPERQIRKPKNFSFLDPNEAWQEIQDDQSFQEVPTADAASGTASKDCTRIVCISDTHGRHREIAVPKGDILIHGGDFTSTGEIHAIQDLTSYFQKLAFPTTICIAGNHDMTLQPNYYKRSWKRFHKVPLNANMGRQLILDFMKDTNTESFSSDDDTNRTSQPKFIYLEDASCTVPVANHGNGSDSCREISIYGSPWSPEFYDWAFNVQRGLPSQEIWSKIPDQTDVLITHGPPLGRGDMCTHGGRAGCYDLLHEVQHRVRPRLHIFGHIHEAYGASFDGTTLFVNASNLDFDYEAVHPCIVVDLPHDLTQPARVVTPRPCTMTGEELKCGEWLRKFGFHELSNALKDSGIPSEDLPSGMELLQTKDAYEAICRLFKKRKIMITSSAKAELRKTLSKLYADSF